LVHDAHHAVANTPRNLFTAPAGHEGQQRGGILHGTPLNDEASDITK